MQITSCYRGATDKLSGVTYDTEKKTFKTWTLNADEWTHTYERNRTMYSAPNDDFAIPGDIDYYHVYKHELDAKIQKLKELNFKEDASMNLIFKKGEKV